MKFVILVNKKELLLLSLVKKLPIKIFYKVDIMVLVINLVAL